jgi:DtxR family Mn-dependent transcriptional regulator
MVFHKDLTLDDLKPQENGTIIAVKEHTPDFLQYLESIRLMPGAVVKLLKVYEYDNSLLIENDGVELHVSDKVSQKILIQKEKN